MSFTAAPRAVLSRPVSRQFSSSAPALGPKSRGAPKLNTGPTGRARPWSVKNLTFTGNDITSAAWMKMFRLEEAEALVQKAVMDKDALRAANTTKFTPPTAPIRVTHTVNLGSPNSRFHTKHVLLIPVASLPLSTPEALNRFKSLAGPRWSPGVPGPKELIAEEEGQGKEGWVKISEERFENSRQNRRSASDMLERLVEAANDHKSPLPSDLPLDTRHLLSRHMRKRSRQNPFYWAPGQIFLVEKKAVGGVQGYPLEWIPEELRQNAVKQ